MNQVGPNEMPPSYVAYDSQPSTEPEPRTGLLLAAGIIAIVEAVPLLLIGVLAVLLGVGSGDDNIFGDLVAVVGAMLAGLGAAWLVAGIGGVLRRQWGRVLLIVGNSLALLGSLRAMLDRANGVLITLPLAVLGLGLAIFGQPRSTRRTN